MSEFVSSAVAGVALGGVFTLIALGLVLAYRATSTLNFAHGEFMLLAAFLVGRWQADRMGKDGIAVVLAILIVGAVGGLFYLAVLRWMIGLPEFVGVIATLGLAAILDGIMGIAFPAGSYSISLSWLPSRSVHLADATVSAGQLIAAAVSIGVAGAITLVLRYSHLGTKIRACGQNPLLASQGGINVQRIYAGSWIIAGLLAGFAGIIYGAINSVDDSIVSVALLVFPATILGGIDSIGGAIVGGILIGLLQSYTATYLGDQYTDLTTYVVLLITLMWIPQGLFGTRRVVRV